MTVTSRGKAATKQLFILGLRLLRAWHKLMARWFPDHKADVASLNRSLGQLSRRRALAKLAEIDQELKL